MPWHTYFVELKHPSNEEIASAAFIVRVHTGMAISQTDKMAVFHWSIFLFSLFCVSTSISTFIPLPFTNTRNNCETEVFLLNCFYATLILFQLCCGYTNKKQAFELWVVLSETLSFIWWLFWFNMGYLHLAFGIRVITAGKDLRRSPTASPCCRAEPNS